MRKSCIYVSDDQWLGMFPNSGENWKLFKKNAINQGCISECESQMLMAPNFFIISDTHMVEKVLFLSQIFEKDILMDLHVLRSRESENHIF